MTATLFRRISVVLMLGFFAFLVPKIYFGMTSWSTELWLSLVFTGLFLATPVFRKHFGRLAIFLRTMPRPTCLKAAFVIFVVWTLADFFLLKLYNRPLLMLWQDEFQFLLQSQHLARFRISMPPHPLVDFFDTFYVFITPRYAAQSFPGAAMLFVPTIWFHLPTWVMPILVTGGSAALIFWVISQITDPLLGSVSAWILLTLSGFRYLSTMYMAQIPVLFLGMLAIAFALEWRRSGGWYWACAFGTAIGWTAITRPVDSIAFVICSALLMLPAIRKWPPLVVTRGVILIVLCAASFAGLQLWSDHELTGQWLKLPFTYYNERDQPALAFSPGQADFSRRPMTHVPQKQWFYDDFALNYMKLKKSPQVSLFEQMCLRLSRANITFLPSLGMLAFLCIGILGLKTLDRLALASLFLFYLIVYTLYPIYLFHYIAFALPSVMLLYAISPGVIADCFPKIRSQVDHCITVFVVMLSGVGVLAQVPHSDDNAMARELTRVNAALGKLHQPSIVLFRVDRKSDFHYEPVYNVSTAWPDDAPIIRAHDRGDDNVTLYRYYAKIQPDREIYLYDRPTETMTDLGNVKFLAERPTTQP